MTVSRLPGRSLVTRRALVDVVRPTVAGSYGVTGLGRGGWRGRLAGWLGVAAPGIRISLAHGLEIDLHLTVAYGLPIAEVARQADSAVRYAVRRAIGREVDRLTIHVGGMHYQPVASGAHGPATDGEPAQLRGTFDVLAEAEAAAAEAAAAQAAAEATTEPGDDRPA
jgi:uncharacterized alkaline shock family protein YloU